MSWICLAVLIYVGGLAVLFLKLGRKHLVVDRQLRTNVEIAEQEKETKTKLLQQIANLSMGLVPQTDLEVIEHEKQGLEENIRAEKGRLTITEAELEAVDTRLRELEELKRELEVSNMDAVKELDMLRSQEREISQKNLALKEKLQESLEQLDLLLGMLQNSTVVVEKLTKAKTELLNTEAKCAYYEEQIAKINNKYMGLKKAYDALDIEYAQLYEKQQSAEEG